MAELKVSPFAGIDHVTGEPNEPKWLKDAVNVDIDRFGGMARRPGMTQVLAGISSVYGSGAVGALVGVYQGQLVALSLSPVGTTVLGNVSDDELWYTEVNGELVFSGMDTLSVVRGGSAVALGIDVPAAPSVSASGAGGMQAGTYGVCTTYVRTDTGEESGASHVVFVDVAKGGGLSVSSSGGGGGLITRTYRTPCNGDVFYHVSDSTGALGAGDRLGHVCETRHLVRMPGGKYLGLWKGRILVARGNVMYMSEPFRFGLHDPRTGFVQLPKKITFLAPLEGGIFVGQPDGVLFIDGPDIMQAKLVNTGASTPLPGSSVIVSGGEMAMDNIDSSQKYAVWLSERGYAVGKPDGGVVEPQASRIRIPVGQSGATVLHDRRVLSLVS